MHKRKYDYNNYLSSILETLFPVDIRKPFYIRVPLKELERRRTGVKQPGLKIHHFPGFVVWRQVHNIVNPMNVYIS